MYRVAFKMLMGDRAKYLLLVSALSFAAMLMTHQGSIFFGLLRWSTATIRNTNAPIWVVDPLVEQPGEILPLLDTDLTLVRSVEGVKWAAPLYFSIQQARLESGSFKPIQLFGLDTGTLIGAPTRMIAGNIEDIWQEGAIIIDEVGIERFSMGRKEPIKLGDRLDINDHEVHLVGICKAERSFFGYPYVYTTFDRAVQLTPTRRKNLSFVLAAPQPGYDLNTVARAIEKETGLKAFTEEAFFWSTISWVFKNTGIPFSFSITIIMGFLVGIAVSGQTFYSFVLENLKHLGALKAMGASNGLLCRMLILQALLVGFIGYGIGIGLTSIFGHLALKKESFPFFMPYHILLITLGAILSICIFAALIGINKVRKYDAAEVFRG
jgi:putative ABC transport system permease protein